MKLVILNSKSGEEDLYRYERDLYESIQSKFPTVTYDEVSPDFSNIPELFDDDEKVVLVNHFALDRGFESLSEYLPKFKNIRYILSPYSAYTGLDLELLKNLGIKYRNNGGANALSVAQYAIASMYVLLSRFVELGTMPTIPDGSILGEELDGKTAGIIGMGHVGETLYTKLNSLAVPTVYYNRTLKESFPGAVAFNEVFNSDIVFITIATNPETTELMRPIHSLIQEKHYIVDVTAHDELYDKQSVVYMLNEGKLRGYALESESRFESDKNLFVTPHIAWATRDAEKRLVKNYLERALTILEGRAEEINFIV